MNEACWFDICRWPSRLTSSFDQRANIANSNIDNMYVMKKMTFYLPMHICIINSSCKYSLVVFSALYWCCK